MTKPEPSACDCWLWPLPPLPGLPKLSVGALPPSRDLDVHDAWVRALVDLVDGQAAGGLHGGGGSTRPARRRCTVVAGQCRRRRPGRRRRRRPRPTRVRRSTTRAVVRRGVIGVRVSWIHVRWRDGVVAWNNRRLKGTSRCTEAQVRPACAVRHELATALATPDTLRNACRPDANAPRRRPSPWAWLVAGSAVVVLGCALVLGVWWLATSEKQIATYSVTRRGEPDDARPRRRRTRSSSAAGRAGRSRCGAPTSSPSAAARAPSARVSGGELRLRSRCPATVLASCSASYRVRVPDNIPVTVATSSGDVRFSAYRGSASIDTTTGDISVGGYCGFLLQARAESGNVLASTSCSPERLVLRSRSGDVRAIVPAGPLPRRRRHRRRHAARRRADARPRTRRSRSRR